MNKHRHLPHLSLLVGFHPQDRLQPVKFDINGRMVAFRRGGLTVNHEPESRELVFQESTSADEVLRIAKRAKRGLVVYH
jgi:hypothetical protein